MRVTLKVGSLFHVPLLAGMSVTSSMPSVVKATVANNVATLTAQAVGSAWITLSLASDVNLQLLVVVSTS